MLPTTAWQVFVPRQPLLRCLGDRSLEMHITNRVSVVLKEALIVEPPRRIFSRLRHRFSNLISKLQYRNQSVLWIHRLKVSKTTVFFALAPCMTPFKRQV